MTAAILHPHQPVALSWTALNCLLCMSSCLAAFCPGVAVHHRHDLHLGFVPPTASWTRHIISSPVVSRQQLLYAPVTISDQQRKTSLSKIVHYSNHEDRRTVSITRLRATVSDNDEDTNNERQERNERRRGVRARVRQSVSKASNKLKRVVSSSSRYYNAPSTAAPIAGVLTDAAVKTAELAAEEVRSAALDVLQRSGKRTNASSSTTTSSSGSNKAMQLETQAQMEAEAQVAMDAILLAKTSVADAFDAAERALSAAEDTIRISREELDNAKRDATLGLAVAEKAAAEAAERARRATESVFVRETLGLMEEHQSEDDEASVAAVVTSNDSQDVAKENESVMIESEDAPSLKSDGSDEVMVDPAAKLGADASEDSALAEEEAIEGETIDPFDITNLTYEDVDYTLTDMAPPFINEDECLVPGEPVVRVEKAPQNSRRIFAGIDIPVSVDDVWELLTDYPNLQKVVPNLVVNEVLKLYPGDDTNMDYHNIPNGGGGGTMDEKNQSDADQCRTLADRMKGAVLKQVGGAKVVGINFSARTTLEVREWPAGMPDFAHFEEEMYEGKSRSARVRESRKRELMRYVFPRPFALSSLPHKDISMQSVEDDDGEFRMYQGVWRMQPLPGCSPPGGSAMRLTYAVEVSPRPYLPVALVEGRIAQDLCANLKAIRDVFANAAAQEREDRDTI